MLERAERPETATRYRDVADLRRPDVYPSWSRDVYSCNVTPREGNEDGLNEWARYLKGIQARPGWSVARLARSSGIHRSTLFRWIGGEVDKISANSARRIAEAVGDDPAIALKAAGDMLDGDTDALGGLDPNDPVVQKIYSLDVDEEMRGFMLDRHRENLEIQRRRWMEDIDRTIGDTRRRGAA